MYLLFSCLTIGGDHSSFTLAVHLGGCSDTLFYPTRHLSKKATRKTYYLHSYPVSVVSLFLSCALFAPVSFFFLHPQHCPQIRQGFSRGELETVHWWSFFFFQSLFLDSAHAPPVVRRWGLLKATVSQFLSTSLKFKFFPGLQVQALHYICVYVRCRTANANGYYYI